MPKWSNRLAKLGRWHDIKLVSTLWYNVAKIADFNNQLRHFMRTTELVDDVVQQNYLHDDLAVMVMIETHNSKLFLTPKATTKRMKYKSKQ